MKNDKKYIETQVEAEKTNVQVVAQAVDKVGGGFTSGQAVSGLFTKKEFDEKMHLKLTEGIVIQEGCYWSFSYEIIQV